MTGDALRLATRGSALARRQAELVRDAVETRRNPVELLDVETTGDRVTEELIHRLGTTGAFVRALDERVLDGEADAAVHSMKDMPTDQPDELLVAGIPERASAGDLLVSPDGYAFEELPEGATVGTGSLRRRAQLLRTRPDLEVEPLRGNVDTRLAKLLAPTIQAEREQRREADAERKGNVGDDDFEPAYDRTVDEWFEERSALERDALSREVDTEYDAIVLAEAGLERSGLLDAVEWSRLPKREFVPAPGQGALAVTATRGATANRIRDAVDHRRTRVETTVERRMLAELGGGCIAPIGIHAVVQGPYVHTSVQVLGGDGAEIIAGTRDLDVERHTQEADEFAADLAARGAADLIEAARREAGEE